MSPPQTSRDTGKQTLALAPLVHAEERSTEMFAGLRLSGDINCRVPRPRGALRWCVHSGRRSPRPNYPPAVRAHGALARGRPVRVLPGGRAFCWCGVWRTRRSKCPSTNPRGPLRSSANPVTQDSHRCVTTCAAAGKKRPSRFSMRNQRSPLPHRQGATALRTGICLYTGVGGTTKRHRRKVQVRSGCSFVASASPSQAGNFLTLNAVLLAPKSRTTVSNNWGKAHG